MRKNNLVIAGVIVVVLLVGVVVVLNFTPSSGPTAPPSMDAIHAMMEAGEYAAARDALKLYLETFPDDAEAHFRLALAQFNLGEYELAREHFITAMTLEPDRAAAVHHNLGVLNYQLGDFQGALDEFQAALAQDPDDADTHYQLGATYLVLAIPVTATMPDAGLLAQAEAEFQQALHLSPQKPEALVGLGNVYLLQDEAPQAVSVLEQAVTAHPDMREAIFALGRAYMQTGQFDAAREALQRFLETEPPQVWAQQAQELLSQLGP